jgi:hypothetical protein
VRLATSSPSNDLNALSFRAQPLDLISDFRIDFILVLFST